MDFIEMSIRLFDKENAMAYRKGWQDITTTVRAVEKNGSQILMYYDLSEQKIPVVVTKETVDCDDWVCIDDIEGRFSIRNFMTMPKAKEMLVDLDEYTRNGNNNVPEQFNTMEYKLRLDEAIKLRIVYPDHKVKRFVITDIGYDLMKI